MSGTSISKALIKHLVAKFKVKAGQFWIGQPDSELQVAQLVVRLTSIKTVIEESFTWILIHQTLYWMAALMLRFRACEVINDSNTHATIRVMGTFGQILGFAYML